MSTPENHHFSRPSGEPSFGLSRRNVLRMSAAAAAIGAVPYLPGTGALTATARAEDREEGSIAPRFRTFETGGEDPFVLYLDGNKSLDDYIAFDYENEDLKYHRSFVPKADRITVSGDVAAQPALDVRPKVADFSEFYGPIVERPGFTRGHDFRYGNARDVHVTRFQQYRDLVSYWQVFTTVPNAALTDVVHRNGGRCIAFMFTSDNVEFNREGLLRQDENGEFTAGNLLVDHALYFGFDGYMFDMESGVIASEDKALVLELFQAMHERASRGGLDIHLQIYGPNHDARTYADWQRVPLEHADYLTTPGAADSWFLDYSWAGYLEDTQETLAATDIDPFEQVYFGIELEGYRESLGVDTTRSDLPMVVPPNGSGEPVGSIALFSLTAETTNLVLAELKAENGGALPDFETVRTAVYEGERRFWSGESQNPAIASDGGADIGQYGMADYVHARSAITALPFITRFNTGASDVFALEGKTVSTEPWYHLGIQDLLPTWQFWTRSLTTGEPTTGPLSVDYDLTTAFDGGASLAITGTPDSDDGTELRLFRTQLALPADAWTSITYQSAADASHLQIGLIFEDDLETTRWHTLDDLKPNEDFGPSWGYGSGGKGWGGGGWNARSSWSAGWTAQRSGTDWRQAVIGLAADSGRTLAGISVAVTAPKSSAVDLRLGEVVVSAASLQSAVPASPTGLVLEKSRLRPDGLSAELRLIWDLDETVAYYDILRRGAEGDVDERTWLGRITADRFYVQNCPLFDGGTEVTVELVAVGSNGRRSEPATLAVSLA